MLVNTFEENQVCREEHLQPPCYKLQCRDQSESRREQYRTENEQIQRQRKERKGEVRRQRHCVRATIKAAPTLSTRPAPPQPLGHSTTGLAGAPLLGSCQNTGLKHKRCKKHFTTLLTCLIKSFSIHSIQNE